MGNIEISKLSEQLKSQAEEIDKQGNKNGKIDRKSGEYVLFAYAAGEKVNTGEISAEEFKDIFGFAYAKKPDGNQSVQSADADKTEEAAKPTKAEKKEIEGKERYILTILEEEAATAPSGLMAKIDERLGVSVNDPNYKEMKETVRTIQDEISNVGYNSKKEVDKLEKTVKKNLSLKDDFDKKVLKALVKNAEADQKRKEFKEISDKYDSLVNNGMGEEEAFKSVKEEFKSKGSYYEEFLKKRGSWLYKATHMKSKMSTFESSYIMPEARTTTREAVYESEAEKSKKVKKDAKKTLKENTDWNKYTKRALNGETTFSDYVSGTDSDMKSARKVQATKNEVMRIRRDGLSEKDVHKAVDKKSTFGSKITFGAFFKKKTQLFEALKNNGLIEDKGDGTYDVSALSELIGENVGADYKLNRQSKEFKALSEKTKTTSALAVATQLENLTPQEAKMLVEMCGYDMEGVGFDVAKGILGATVGALVNGIGGGIAAATNPKQTFDASVEAHQEVKLNFKAEDGVNLSDIENALASIDGAEITTSTAEGVLNVVISQDASIPRVIDALKFIPETALKSAIFGAAAGLLAGLNDNSEKPITSTQFDCTDLKSYKERLENEAKNGAVSHKYVEALMMIANTFVKKDGTWDCDGYKAFLNRAAGDGGVLNREELLGALGELKEDEAPIEEVQNDESPANNSECEECKASVGKEEDTYSKGVERKSKGEVKAWVAGAKAFYPCLVEKYGPGKAASILKAAQAVRDENYDVERLLKMVGKGVGELRKMDPVEGFDMDYYIKLRLAEDLPDTVFLPDSIGDCDKDPNAKVVNANVRSGGQSKAPTTDYTGKPVKTADGRSYVEFCDNTREYIPAGKTADDVCKKREADLKAQGQNVKITLEK